jgi:UDP-N-acetylglucosamine 2-epimerase (non-hydrolysing)
MSTLNIAVVAAERGGFVRAAPLLAELQARAECRPQFVFAGADYVPYAASELFRDLRLPYADAVIGTSEGTPAERIARTMAVCERLASGTDADAIVLVGQSPTILGCAVACARSPLPVAHADAGLRLPGIAGRTSIAALIDRAASLLPAASEQAHDRLLDEGRGEDTVVLAGSLVGDAIAACLEPARANGAAERAGLEPKDFALAVVESPAIIEHAANLRKLVDLLARVQEELPVAIVVHRRLAQRLEEWELAQIAGELPALSNVEPRGYVEFLSLLDAARLVLTDVGGVQDEATFLGVPVLTLADATDRAATVDCGNNTLVGLDAFAAMQAVVAVVTNGYPRGARPAWWDGAAAARVADALLQRAGKRS